MVYACQWRNTKDIDLYIPERERDRMIRLVQELGLDDYYDVLPYDRKWIYRSHKGDTIVDLIWAMANQHSSVDESWFRGPTVEVDGETFQLLAPEEALWSKLFVLQRDRCDWPDALNLLWGVGPEMDWRHLLHRVNGDAALLSGLLAVFSWVYPEGASALPPWLWDELGLMPPKPENARNLADVRARLLDSRPWFTPTLNESANESERESSKEPKGC